MKVELRTVWPSWLKSSVRQHPFSKADTRELSQNESTRQQAEPHRKVMISDFGEVSRFLGLCVGVALHKCGNYHAPDRAARHGCLFTCHHPLLTAFHQLAPSNMIHFYIKQRHEPHVHSSEWRPLCLARWVRTVECGPHLDQSPSSSCNARRRIENHSSYCGPSGQQLEAQNSLSCHFCRL